MTDYVQHINDELQVRASLEKMTLPEFKKQGILQFAVPFYGTKETAQQILNEVNKALTHFFQ